MEATQRTWYVGIDPDVDKSGVAVWNGATKEWVSLECLGFADLVKWLSANRERIREIRLEGGWLNKSNWHTQKGMSIAKVANMGRDLGRNQQTGILIGELVEGLCIAPLKIVKPLNNNWWAEDKQKRFNTFTGWAKLSNPEKRDAAMLVFGL